MTYYVPGMLFPVGQEESERHVIEQLWIFFHEHVPCIGDDMKFG